MRLWQSGPRSLPSLSTFLWGLQPLGCVLCHSSPRSIGQSCHKATFGSREALRGQDRGQGIIPPSRAAVCPMATCSGGPSHTRFPAPLWGRGAYNKVVEGAGRAWPLEPTDAGPCPAPAATSRLSCGNHPRLAPCARAHACSPHSQIWLACRARCNHVSFRPWLHDPPLPRALCLASGSGITGGAGAVGGRVAGPAADTAPIMCKGIPVHPRGCKPLKLFLN